VLTKREVLAVIEVYMKAWAEQDPNLITTIFTPTATYYERVLTDAPMAGRDGIRAYWQAKVVGAQANIECRLLHLYLDGETAVAEWEALFDDLAQGTRKRMREVAILDFDGGLISRLREYWASQEVAKLATADSAKKAS